MLKKRYPVNIAIEIFIIGWLLPAFMNENKNKYREIKLAQELNGFMYNFGLENFYSKLSIDKILQLKQILSDINNIITLRVTRLFVDFLLHEGIIDNTHSSITGPRFLRFLLVSE